MSSKDFKFKERADREHDRRIAELEARERRNSVFTAIPVADLRRAARSLASRAEQLRAQRDRDPVLRAAADQEALNCQRIADAFAALAREAR